MEKELVSIIVPVYNVEKYLANTLNSVLCQTYSNIEVLLIDDGSLDSSGIICDDYKIKDSRIKVFHKKNGGLSDARNYGLKKANGKYVSFIDSDDIICSDYVEYLYNLIKKYDTKMSICRYKVISEKQIDNLVIDDEKYDDYSIDRISALKHLLLEDIFTVSSCSKMYSIALFNDVEFPFGKLYEDNGTTYKLIDNCDNIAYGEEYKYFYIKRENSITTSSFSERKLDLIFLTDEMCDYLEKYEDMNDEINKKRIASRFTIINQLSKCNMLNTKIAKEYITFLKNNKSFILKSNLVAKREKLAIILLCVNKKLYSFIWRLYEKIKYRGAV